jgi:flavin reductase (DIM6/NTAB) family NADH-FMN oxidoreductase RutF
MTPRVSEEEFRAALGSFAAGVTIVTTIDPGGLPYGLTATAFSSVTLAPPTCLVCVSRDAEAHPVIERTARFGVNLLSAAQAGLSTRFATTGLDKFAAGEWTSGSTLGVPLLTGAVANLECRVTASHVIGSHSVFYGEIAAISVSDSAPLVYLRGRYGTFCPLAAVPMTSET